VLLSGGLGPGHPFGTDYGDPVGGGACRHGEAKPPDAPRPDSADVPIPAPGHAAALVQPLNPDPNVPGVHRSVVEHAPTHRLQARNRLIYLPSYPQGRSSHRFLSLACRWVQGQEAHESEVPHQSRRHVHHSRAGSDESRDGLVRCDPRSPPATGQATPQAPSPVLFPRSPVPQRPCPGAGLFLLARVQRVRSPSPGVSPRLLAPRRRSVGTLRSAPASVWRIRSPMDGVAEPDRVGVARLGQGWWPAQSRVGALGRCRASRSVRGSRPLGSSTSSPGA